MSAQNISIWGLLAMLLLWPISGHAEATSWVLWATVEAGLPEKDARPLLTVPTREKCFESLDELYARAQKYGPRLDDVEDAKITKDAATGRVTIEGKQANGLSIQTFTCLPTPQHPHQGN